MGNRWRKAKALLRLNLCVHVPRTAEDEVADVDGRFSPVAADAAANSIPVVPIPASSVLGLSSSVGRSSKKTCAICLGTMKPGHGHALFTAECSHTFHFHCIASNVKYGNYICPVCRAKWKEIPFQGPLSSDLQQGAARVNPVSWARDDSYMAILRRLPRITSPRVQRNLEPLSTLEPNNFDDDEPSESQTEVAQVSQNRCVETVEMKMFPEFSAIAQSASEENFTVLIHLKASLTNVTENLATDIPPSLMTPPQNCRAPVDLVTVLDVSGSMAGTKLALLKRAMGFVIQNLGPLDRLSVITFSSTARRLFHLRRMSENGRQQALQSVNSLVSTGGTNIAEALRKAAKVIADRREKNPVCSIILLSDGQDTYTVPVVANQAQPDYGSLVPSCIRIGTGNQVPVHTFGFGTDHDSDLMHSISETTGGTFSFIEAENVIQDAFAQCIGGLLSVVVQGMRIEVKPMHQGVHLCSIKSGSYASRVSADRLTGSIDVGDLYADEDRDFLISINIPPASEDTVLLKVDCSYRDPVRQEIVNMESKEVQVPRPEFVTERAASIEVDRQKNRVHAAEAMAEARAAAERGALPEAVTILEECRRSLADSLSARSHDELCVALDAELREMQDRMANRHRYETSGRAYVLSGLSSHSWQRATARGNSTDSGSLVHAYQTPSMVDMLQRSQTLSPFQRPKPAIQLSRSFCMQPEPR